MQRPSRTFVFALLLSAASIVHAAANLNLSKSNVYRVVYDTSAMTAAQATALLAELDKLGPADEAKLKQWLPANFKRLGIQQDKIRKIVVRPDAARKSVSIMFLTNPADEAAAIAVSDPGMPADKPSKKGTK